MVPKLTPLASTHSCLLSLEKGSLQSGMVTC